MKRLEYMRREQRKTQRRLGDESGVNASYICNAERRGMVLYPGQAARLAKALGWSGDPMELFEEVNVDAAAK